MNSRERFLATMEFDKDVHPPKWEYAYWGATLNRWYNEGLPKKQFVKLPERITTPTSSLYLTAFKQNRQMIENGIIPEGLAVFGSGVYSPTQGLPIEHDAEEYLDMDKGVKLIDVNCLFYPMFEPKIENEDEQFVTYWDIDGCKRLYQKKESTIPHTLEWVIRDPKDWQKLKAERLNVKDIEKRFPSNWNEMVDEYQNRDYPLAIGGYPHGMFGLPAHLMGYENLFYAYYDEPEMIHDILDTFTDLWINIYEQILADVQVDMLHIFEDVSMGTGSMVSHDIFNEFMVPRYKKLTGFMKSKGVKNIMLDTDGNCYDIIPHFIEGGITCLYPMEVSAGMDIAKVRKDFPELRMMGGIPKMEISKGKGRIDELLYVVDEQLDHGGYIPFLDHSVPPNVSWEDFKYYRTQLNTIIDKHGR